MNGKGKVNNFIFMLLSIILFFLVGEISLRFVKFSVNMTGGYLNFVCFHWVTDKYKIPVNLEDPYLFWRGNQRDGYFRGRYFSSIKAKNIYRIICLGDSITQGFMLPPNIVRPEETYPYILEFLLNKKEKKIYFEVINAGVGGYSSFQGLRYLKSELLEYNPDLLIVWFGHQDINPAILYSDKEQKFPNKTFVKLNKILSYSKFYQFYKQAIFYFLGRSKGKRVSVNDYHENLTEMVKLSKERNIEIVFIVPFRIEDSRILSFEDFPDTLSYAKVFDYFREKGIFVIDAADIFKHRKNFIKYFFDDCHPTSEGNRLIAEAVYDFLINNKVILVASEKNN